MKYLSIINIPHGLRGIALTLTLFSTLAFGQYSVGESISQQSKDRTVIYCANELGNETIGELLTPAMGEPTRVLWLNFFASW